jgi:hypothetical protein
LSSIFDDNGQRFIQLDTYGSNEREHSEKVSQSVQFDKKAAEQLLKLIREAFPDLG